MGLTSACVRVQMARLQESLTWVEKPSQNLDNLTAGKGKKFTRTHSAMSKLPSYIHLYPDGLSK